MNTFAQALLFILLTAFSTVAQIYENGKDVDSIYQQDTVSNKSHVVIIDMTPRVKDPEYSKDQLVDKIDSYARLRNHGIGLMLPGAVLLPIGVYLFSSLNRTSSDSSTFLSPAVAIFKIIGGAITVGVGTPLLIAGTTMVIIGERKRAEYEQRYNRLSLQINLNSARIVYDF